MFFSISWSTKKPRGRYRYFYIFSKSIGQTSKLPHLVSGMWAKECWWGFEFQQLYSRSGLRRLFRHSAHERLRIAQTSIVQDAEQHCFPLWHHSGPWCNTMKMVNSDVARRASPISRRVCAASVPRLTSIVPPVRAVRNVHCLPAAAVSQPVRRGRGASRRRRRRLPVRRSGAPAEATEAAARAAAGRRRATAGRRPHHRRSGRWLGGAADGTPAATTTTRLRRWHRESTSRSGGADSGRILGARRWRRRPCEVRHTPGRRLLLHVWRRWSRRRHRKQHERLLVRFSFRPLRPGARRTCGSVRPRFVWRGIIYWHGLWRPRLVRRNVFSFSSFPRHKFNMFVMYRRPTRVLHGHVRYVCFLCLSSHNLFSIFECFRPPTKFAERACHFSHHRGAFIRWMGAVFVQFLRWNTAMTARRQNRGWRLDCRGEDSS